MRARLYVAAVLGGLGALVVVAVVVLRVGRIDPSPPQLAGHPNNAIPGEIVYLDRNDCIVRAAASGAWRVQVYCLALAQYALRPDVTRVDKDTVAYFQWSEPTYELVEINLTTKAVRHTVAQAARLGEYGLSGIVSPSGEVLAQDNDRGIFVVSSGARTKVAEFETPEYRSPHLETWSPDGKWFALRYYADEAQTSAELWILSRDGKVKGTLVADAGYSMVSWWIDGLGAWPKVMQERPK